MGKIRYERVNINKARKLWLNGEKIYCLPIYSRDCELMENVYLSVYTSNEKHESFDSFITLYKSVSRYNMRYYIEYKGE